MKKIADIWELPFDKMKGCEIKVKDASGNSAFDYFGESPDVDTLLKYLNDPESYPEDPLIGDYEVKGPDIYREGKLWLRIRGWGFLTGHGSFALGLSPEEAIKKQTILRAYIISKVS